MFKSLSVASASERRQRRRRLLDDTLSARLQCLHLHHRASPPYVVTHAAAAASVSLHISSRHFHLLVTRCSDMRELVLDKDHQHSIRHFVATVPGGRALAELCFLIGPDFMSLL